MEFKFLSHLQSVTAPNFVAKYLGLEYNIQNSEWKNNKRAVLPNEVTEFDRETGDLNKFERNDTVQVRYL